MSLRRLWAIIRKEIIHITRDTRTVVIVLIMPLLQMILLGYTVLNDIQDIPMAVCDLSLSASSRDLVAAYRVTDLFDIRYVAGGENEIVRLLDEGEIQLGMIIPPDYEETLNRRQKAQVGFYLDGSNPIVSLTALTSVQFIAQSKSTEIVQHLLGGGTSAPVGGIDVRPKVWYNPNLVRANFTIPALIGMVMQSFMSQLVAGAIVREREMGTMEQLIATPLRPLELILGKVVPYIGLASLTTLEILGMGLLWFRVPVKGSFMLLMLYCLFFMAAMLGWAVFISAVARTDREARTLNLFIMLPSMFFSGMFFPRTSMPRILQLIGDLVPLTHFLVMIRAVVLKGVGINMVVPQVIGLAAFGVISIWLATRSFEHKVA
ncbi:MAG: ABC transporter permease [Chloroflexota bacterium]|nr:ABC transporter permease [Chloroflexota bacterium]